MPYVPADRSLPRSLDVQISLSRPQAESRTNLSIMCLACENLGFLPNENRVRFYSSMQAVENDFAPGTEAHFGASTFFAQTPRAQVLAIGEVFMSALPGRLVCPPLAAGDITALAAISNGSIKLRYSTDGGDIISVEELTGLDFTGVTTIEGIANIINLKLAGSPDDIQAVVVQTPGGKKQLAIETTTSGPDYLVYFAQDIESVGATTSIVNQIKGSQSAGAILLPGYATTGLADELASIEAAAYASSQYIYGWTIGRTLRTKANQQALAEWILPRTAVAAIVTNDEDAIDPSKDDDIGSIVSASGNRRIACMYHDNQQRYPDVSILAYMLHVDYRMKDSTVTAKFKQLPGIETVRLTETQWNALKAKGYNTYTAIGNNARTYRDGSTSDAGWFLDTTINLDNFIEDLSVNVLNVFLRNKKVPYTTAGQMLILDACEDTGYQYKFNGTFADREVPDRTSKSGVKIVPAYQAIPTPISQMSVADRSSRIGPPIVMIVQEAGAIHSVAINVEVVS